MKEKEKEHEKIEAKFKKSKDALAKIHRLLSTTAFTPATAWIAINKVLDGKKRADLEPRSPTIILEESTHIESNRYKAKPRTNREAFIDLGKLKTILLEKN